MTLPYDQDNILQCLRKVDIGYTPKKKKMLHTNTLLIYQLMMRVTSLSHDSDTNAIFIMH